MPKYLVALLLAFCGFNSLSTASPPTVFAPLVKMQKEAIASARFASSKNLYTFIALPAESPHEIVSTDISISTDGTYLAENMTIDAFGAGLIFQATTKDDNYSKVKDPGALHIAPGWNSSVTLRNTTVIETKFATTANTGESPPIETAAINGVNHTGDPTIYSGFPAPVGWQSDISLFLLSTGMPVHSDQLAAALT